MSAEWWVSTGPRSGFAVDVECVAAQLIRDAFRDALGPQWRRRAEQIAGGLSRPGDFPGRLTAAQIAERDKRIRADVSRCLAHAQLLEQGDPYEDDLQTVLAEVAA